MDLKRQMELKSALKTRLDNMDRATAAIKLEENGTVVSPELRDDFRKNHAEAIEIKSLLDGAQFAGELREWLENPETKSFAQADGARGGLLVPQMLSLGEAFTASAEFKALDGGRNGATMHSPWAVEGADLGSRFETKDVTTTSGPVQSTRGFGRTTFDPIVPREYRRSRIRDLFPVVGTTSNLIDYFRVLGFGGTRGIGGHTSSARPVAERTAADGVSAGNAVFGLKPQSSLTFESAQAPVRTIAHYEVAHRNVLADEPQLQGTINNELLYGLRIAEDAQLLSGDGTGENLLGILNTPGVQVYNRGTTDAGETRIDALRRAATRAALAFYEPTGYVLHPFDWEAVELTKTTEGSYILATNVAIGAEARIWRQPVVSTPAMTQGTYLTGAWGLGATLYDREIGNIRIAEQHSDFFIRNAVAILAEERIALAVKRPEAFVKGTL